MALSKLRIFEWTELAITVATETAQTITMLSLVICMLVSVCVLLARRKANGATFPGSGYFNATQKTKHAPTSGAYHANHAKSLLKDTRYYSALIR